MTGVTETQKLLHNGGGGGLHNGQWKVLVRLVFGPLLPRQMQTVQPERRPARIYCQQTLLAMWSWFPEGAEDTMTCWRAQSLRSANHQLREEERQHLRCLLMSAFVCLRSPTSARLFWLRVELRLCIAMTSFASPAPSFRIARLSIMNPGAARSGCFGFVLWSRGIEETSGSACFSKNIANLRRADSVDAVSLPCLYLFQPLRVRAAPTRAHHRDGRISSRASICGVFVRALLSNAVRTLCPCPFRLCRERAQELQVSAGRVCQQQEQGKRRIFRPAAASPF